MSRISEQLQRHEGLRLWPYMDTVGKLTIGIGRNLTDRGITRDEALLMLDNDIEECVTDLEDTFPWFITLNDVRQRVLIDMRFNLGQKGLKGFKNMLANIAANEYERAAVGMLRSKWAKQVGKRAVTLAMMMRTGKESL